MFYLPELTTAIMVAGEVLYGRIPPTGEVRILDTLHTRDFHKSFHNLQSRFRSLYAQSAGREGIMFRLSTGGALNGADTVGMIVRDEVMENLLIKACRNFKIVLPRSAQKVVVARDLAIGFEFVFDTLALGDRKKEQELTLA
ncbi:MAG: hypothetical protein JWO78_1874 [Micavibrio sp.]|nr:hypothetical protein [Micavibrio sp.]